MIGRLREARSAIAAARRRQDLEWKQLDALLVRAIDATTDTMRTDALAQAADLERELRGGCYAVGPILDAALPAVRRRGAAVHEAGHLVACEAFGVPVAEVSIWPIDGDGDGGEMEGHLLPLFPFDFFHLDRRARAAIALAGPMAHAEVEGFSFWRTVSDFDMALSALDGDDGTDAQRELTESLALATVVVRRRWRRVLEVAARLGEAGTIVGRELALPEDFGAETVEAHVLPPQQQAWIAQVAALVVANRDEIHAFADNPIRAALACEFMDDELAAAGVQ